MGKIKRALISVANKDGLVPFAKKLSKMGVEIISTGGTAKLLKEEEIAVRDISEVTGFPEMLDGRVKTLHPKVHGGILARRGDKCHMEEVERHNIGLIDMVVVNLYPFEATISKPGCTFEEAIENIDIGGPTMIRSAAKNFNDVAVIVDPLDYSRILEEMEKSGNDISRETRYELARKVFLHTARYDSIISNYLEGREEEERKVRFPGVLTLQLEKVQNLRYGENPHQQAAFYREFNIKEPSVSKARQIQGKELSFNNILDANSALELAKEFEETVSVIVKHNNPCGVAVSDSPGEAFKKARESDPISAFGGVVAFNRVVDLDAARELTSTFLEVIIAPGFAKEAIDELKKKKDLRLLDIGASVFGIREGMDMKKVAGGLLLQDRDIGMVDSVKRLDVVTKRGPTVAEYEALSFAWRIAKHVKSNAIVYSRDGQTIGIGAGQMSRVDSVKIAAIRAVLQLNGCVMASDAFFPFRDGVDGAANVGITAVIQPGGSVKDDEVIKAADEHNMAMVFTGMRHFKH
ncbi:MAG: bifunctional phosphoribosylaminoimidazolecarboxamide formyltransferase/IMP cyclohydrolase [Nitrospirota bacterium]